LVIIKRISLFKEQAEKTYINFNYEKEDGNSGNLIDEIASSDFGRFGLDNGVLDIMTKSFNKNSHAIKKSFAKIESGRYITIAETDLTYHSGLSNRTEGDKVTPVYNLDLVYLLSDINRLIKENNIENTLNSLDDLFKTTISLNKGIVVFPKALETEGTYDELKGQDYGFVPTNINSVVDDNLEEKLEVDIKGVDLPRIIFSFESIKNLINTKEEVINIVSSDTGIEEEDEDSIFNEEDEKLEEKTKVDTYTELNAPITIEEVKLTNAYKILDVEEDLESVINNVINVYNNNDQDFEMTPFNTIFENNKKVMEEYEFDNVDDFKKEMKKMLIRKNC